MNVALRDVERELRTFAHFAFDLNIAPMRLDNAARDGKPQACASAATA